LIGGSVCFGVVMIVVFVVVGSVVVAVVVVAAGAAAGVGVWVVGVGPAGGRVRAIASPVELPTTPRVARTIAVI
jgi:hypothetical protein